MSFYRLVLVGHNVRTFNNGLSTVSNQKVEGKAFLDEDGTFITPSNNLLLKERLYTFHFQKNGKYIYFDKIFQPEIVYSRVDFDFNIHG